MRDRKCRMARKVANNLNITLYLGQNQHLEVTKHSMFGSLSQLNSPPPPQLTFLREMSKTIEIGIDPGFLLFLFFTII